MTIYWKIIKIKQSSDVRTTEYFIYFCCKNIFLSGTYNPESRNISLTVSKIFAPVALPSSIVSTFNSFFKRSIVLITMLCLLMLTLLCPWFLFIVVLRRVSQECRNARNSGVMSCVSWNCMSACVQGCEVSVAVSLVSFLEKIACLNIELRVFQPADDWFLLSWTCSSEIIILMERNGSSGWEGWFASPPREFAWLLYFLHGCAVC